MKLATTLLVLAALLAAPSAAGGKDPTALGLKITLERTCYWSGCGPYAGTFAASGAISDRGAAMEASGSGLYVRLDGRRGSIAIAVDGGTFAIVGGTGAYANLHAAGSVKSTLKFRPWRRKQSNGATGTEFLTLELDGSVS